MPIDAPIHVNEANLSRVLGAGVPVVLAFWRRECPHCEQIAPALDRLARRFAGRALIAKVNVIDEPRLAQRYRADRLPLLVFIKQTQETDRAIGAVAEADLAPWLEYLTGARNSRPPAPSGPSSPLDGRAATPPPATDAAQTGSAPAGAGAGGKTGQPITVTDANFDRLLRESQTPVLVDFWAAWCGPCKMIAPAVADLAREFAGRAVVGKLNVDENPRTAGRYGVMSIPTLLIFKNGQVVDQIVGAQPAPALRQRLAKQVG
jgi:thioredoxin 1